MMKNYSRIFGSQYPENTIELSNYKDIGEATDNVKQLIQQFYAFVDDNNYESANALYESNKKILKPYYIGMEVLNKIEEEIYNTQIYVSKEANTVISESEPDINDYNQYVSWLKPI